MTQPNAPEIVCASCGSKTSGRFCSNCGASLETLSCAQCGATLSPGARFCHKCGTPVTGSPARAATPRTQSSSLPWVVASIALIALLAFLAGSAFNRNSAPGSSQTASQTPLGDAGGAADAPGVIRAPDISQLSPEERADRLYKRVMALSAAGKSDSVLFFAPMAIESYQMLSPLNTDQRYDLGRIAEVAGAYPLAQAQADTILASNPSHLLGLVLAARVALADKRMDALEEIQSRLVKAYPSESAKKLPEYDRHSDEIEAALSTARKSGGT